MNSKTNKKSDEQKNSMSMFLKDFLIIFIVAIVLAVLIKGFVIDSRIVPSASMVPTVQINDRVLINKVPLYYRDPERGEVVVFKPNDTVGENKDLLKRIIGVPGDTIEVRDGLVYVNGEALEETYIAEAPDYSYGPIEVPEGYYFMLGDNRNHSFDSHLWPDPFVSKDDIKGIVWVTYWPISSMKTFK